MFEDVVMIDEVYEGVVMFVIGLLWNMLFGSDEGEVCII